MKEDGLGHPSPVLIHASIGIHSIVKNNINFNFHFRTRLGDEWTVSWTYSDLKNLDCSISQRCLNLKTTSFPVFDKNMILYLFDISQLGVPETIFVFDELIRRLEIWMHSVLFRYHMFPLDVKEDIASFFALVPSLVFLEDDGGDNADMANDQKLRASFVPKVKGKSLVSILSKPFFKSPTAELSQAAVEQLIAGVNVGSSQAPTIKSSGVVPKKTAKRSKEYKDRNEELEKTLIYARPPLQVVVKRCREGRMNRVEYEVSLHFDMKSFFQSSNAQREPYVIYRRYNDFKSLWKELATFNVISIDRIGYHLEALGIDNSSLYNFRSKNSSNNSNNNGNSGNNGSDNRDRLPFLILNSHFPLPPFKCSLGIKINEQDLALRARLLDLWMREVCFHYGEMNVSAKAAVRRFFDFSLSNAEDIYYHDQLSRGFVEGSRAEIPWIPQGMSVPTPTLLQSQPPTPISHGERNARSVANRSVANRSVRSEETGVSSNRRGTTKKSKRWGGKKKSPVGSDASSISGYENCSEYSNDPEQAIAFPRSIASKIVSKSITTASNSNSNGNGNGAPLNSSGDEEDEIFRRQRMSSSNCSWNSESSEALGDGLNSQENNNMVYKTHELGVFWIEQSQEYLDLDWRSLSFHVVNAHRNWKFPYIEPISSGERRFSPLAGPSFSSQSSSSLSMWDSLLKTVLHAEIRPEDLGILGEIEEERISERMSELGLPSSLAMPPGSIPIGANNHPNNNDISGASSLEKASKGSLFSRTPLIGSLTGIAKSFNAMASSNSSAASTSNNHSSNNNSNSNSNSSNNSKNGIAGNSTNKNNSNGHVGFSNSTKAGSVNHGGGSMYGGPSTPMGLSNGHPSNGRGNGDPSSGMSKLKKEAFLRIGMDDEDDR